MQHTLTETELDAVDVCICKLYFRRVYKLNDTANINEKTPPLERLSQPTSTEIIIVKSIASEGVLDSIFNRDLNRLPSWVELEEIGLTKGDLYICINFQYHHH